MAQEKAPLEKPDLKIGFIAITCATPLIMAGPFLRESFMARQ
jgi:nitrate/nitrite transport system substrate-binding protein